MQTVLVEIKNTILGLKYKEVVEKQFAEQFVNNINRLTKITDMVAKIVR